MRRSRSLQLRFECTEDWSSLEGDHEKRHCEHCDKHVRNLSALTRSEATALFESPPPEGLCVRYHHDGQGRILFRSERYPGRMAWKRFIVPSPSS